MLHTCEKNILKYKRGWIMLQNMPVLKYWTVQILYRCVCVSVDIPVRYFWLPKHNYVRIFTANIWRQQKSVFLSELCYNF